MNRTGNKTAPRRKKRLTALALLLAAITIPIGALWIAYADSRAARAAWISWHKGVGGPPPLWMSGPDFNMKGAWFAPDGQSRNPTYVGSLWGYENPTTGETLVAPIFRSGDAYFQEGLSKVTKVDGTSGYINTQGQWLFTVADHLRTEPSVNGLIRTTRTATDGYPRTGFLNHAGEVVIPIEYEASWFYHGVTLLGDRTWIGGITRKLSSTFEITISTPFDYKWHLVDNQGNPVSPSELQSPR